MPLTPLQEMFSRDLIRMGVRDTRPTMTRWEERCCRQVDEGFRQFFQGRGRGLPPVEIAMDGSAQAWAEELGRRGEI